MFREERIGPHRLFLGDCMDVMPTLGKVDAVITSPPYDNLRDYGPGFEGVDCLAVIAQIARRLAPGGVCMWNVADATVDGSETGSSFRQALHAMECGLRLHDTMIYCKGGVTYPDANRYLPCFEYMFIFSNGAPKTFNGLKDRPNKWAGTKMHGTDRQKDGKTTVISGVGRPVPAFGLRRNWWEISNAYTGETAGHPAPMPYSMAADHAQTWTNEGETILDPFAGSGTTGVACQKLGRTFIGIEKDPDYFAIMCKRIDEAMRQPDLFIAPPAPAKQETLDL
jgi:DNA modification methylase